jgi:hypothetical protein
MHAYERHVHERHAYERHAHGMDAYVRHALTHPGEARL